MSSIPGLKPNQALVLIDGVCNMCNGFAIFVLARDSNERFKFASLQSDFAKKILQEYNLPDDMQSIILIEPDGSCYQKSTAVLRIAKFLDFPWWLLYSFIIVPRPLRDLVYNLIAQSRYRLWGKKETCEFHSEWRHRFITDSESDNKNI